MFTLKLITFINAILADPYPAQLMYIMALQLISGIFPINDVVIFSTLSSYNAFKCKREEADYYSLFIGIMDIVFVLLAAHEYGAKETVQTYIASSFITILGLQYGAGYALIQAL
jgi:hypothetical protein